MWDKANNCSAYYITAKKRVVFGAHFGTAFNLFGLSQKSAFLI